MVSPKLPLYLISAVMVMAIAVTAFSLDDPEDDCLVKYSVRMEQPWTAPKPLLAYVSRSTDMTLGFFFLGVKDEEERDAVRLNSTGALHAVVRGGKSTYQPVDLPRLIPEGWNTFTVAVERKRVTLTLVQGQDHLTLLTLSLPRSVKRVLVEGTVARCSTSSPKWEMAGKDVVKVVLQPGGSEQDQWLELSSGKVGAATSYISFPSSPDTLTPVPANTILRITSTLRGDHVLLKVFKDGDGGGEEVVEERVPITPPLTMLVNSDDGAFHLHLLLSRPLMHEAQIDPDISSGARSSGSEAVLGVSFAVMACLVVVGAALFWWRRKNRHLLSRRALSRDKVIPKNLRSLCQRKDFEDRLKLPPSAAVKTLQLDLAPDPTTAQLLKELRNVDVSTVELLLVNVNSPSRLHHYLDGLPALPSIEKVKLDVAGFTKRDLDKVCALVMKLQPPQGYATIDFRNKNNNNEDGEVLRQDAWEELLRGLHEKEVKVKGQVWLPAGAISPEHQRLLPLNFNYGCRCAE